MKRQSSPNEPSTFARRYAVASLIAVLFTATSLAILYRELSIRTVVEFGEQSNVTAATTTLHQIRPELNGYLRSGEALATVGTTETAPPRLVHLIQAAVRDTVIERVKIYNRNGIVLYSTVEHEVGMNDGANPLFIEAIGGEISSKLRYHDAFSLFEPTDRDDNLTETYVPIWLVGESQPAGVLEIYTNVGHLVRALAHSEVLIFSGIGLIMIILYGVLLLVVRRLDRTIASQRQTITERTRMLETLSARMLDSEEGERRRIARELHEEIAQTLSAAKMRVEALADATAQDPASAGNLMTEEVVPLVQAAIRDVRGLAMDLRPPALDDFGLVASTHWLCREAERVRPQARITPDISVQDTDVPDSLKGIIFRITQETLKRLIGTPGVGDIRVALRHEKGLQLSVDFEAESGMGGNGAESSTPRNERPIADLWERAVLSGAAFTATYSAEGRSCYQATWTD